MDSFWIVLDNGTLQTFREYAGGKLVNVCGFATMEDAQTYLRGYGYDPSAFEIKEMRHGS